MYNINMLFMYKKRPIIFIGLYYNIVRNLFISTVLLTLAPTTFESFA